MREIKFRAWEKHLKEMIPVVDIDFEAKMINRKSAWRLFGEIELMQFTGLHDKNGKEIYEGDIIACKFHPEWCERIDWSQIDIVASVTWDLCGFGLDATNSEGDRRYPQLSDLCFNESEVIGNVWENAGNFETTESPNEVAAV